MMRCIIHDWADEYAIKILRQLRNAAGPDTKLMVIDSIISHACPTPESTKHIAGVAQDPLPKPLLPNRGAANGMGVLTDMQVSQLTTTRIMFTYQLISYVDACGDKRL